MICSRLIIATLLLAGAAAAAATTAAGQTYSSRTVSTFPGNGLTTALDPAGDLYFASYVPGSGYQIRELAAVNGIIPTGTAPVVITAVGITQPQGLAMDKNGNLFVIDNGFGTVLKEVVAVNGKLPATPVAITLYTPASPASLQNFLATDSNGNVFFEEDPNGGSIAEYIKELLAVAGAVPPTPSAVTIYTLAAQGGLGSTAFISTLATDTKNNLYYLNNQTNSIYELPITGGAVAPGTASQKILGLSSSSTSMQAAFGFDKSGNLFYTVFDLAASPFTSNVYMAAAVSGTLPASPVIQNVYSDVNTNFTPQGFATDPAGDVFFTSAPGAVIELSTAAIGSLTIAPTTQTFASTAVNASSTTLTSTLSNTTAAPIYLSSGSLTDATDFTQTDNCSGLIAATNGTCAVTFTFTPKSAGTLSSTYSIHDLNNASSPLTVALSGAATVALVPQTVLTPTAITFTTVANVAASNQTLTLSNPGTGPLTIAGIGINGPNSTTFSVVSRTCTATLAAGATCSIVVGCSATTFGSYSATLTVTENATPTTQSSTLTCNVNGTSQATLTPATLDFGSVTVGSTTGTMPLTLANPGTAPLTTISVALTGANTASFAIASNNCGATLAPAATCTIGLMFTPSAVGTAAAALTVTDSLGTQASALTGTAIAANTPDFAILKDNPDTLHIAYGGTAVFGFNVYSTSSANPLNTPVVLTVSGLPKGFTGTFTSPTATPGTSGVYREINIVAPSQPQARHVTSSGLPLGITLVGLTMLFTTRKKKGSRRLTPLAMLAFVALLPALVALQGCGDDTPATDATITVTGTNAANSHSVTFYLSVY